MSRTRTFVFFSAFAILLVSSVKAEFDAFAVFLRKEAK